MLFWWKIITYHSYLASMSLTKSKHRDISPNTRRPKMAAPSQGTSNVALMNVCFLCFTSLTSDRLLPPTRENKPLLLRAWSSLTYLESHIVESCGWECIYIYVMVSCLAGRSNRQVFSDIQSFQKNCLCLQTHTHTKHILIDKNV